VQKYLNFWFSSSLDLFGGEVSSNAASYFAAGLKGRAKEESVHRPPGARQAPTPWTTPKDGVLVDEDVPLRTR
jgi:benzoyl-CoA 2,3-dioxygenase component B